MRNYPALMAAFYGQVLALTTAKAESIDAFLRIKAAGGNVTGDDLAAACDGRRESVAELVDTTGAASTYTGPPTGSEARYVAVVPLFGVMMQHASLMSEMSGGTSTEVLSQQLRQLDAAPAVKSIVLNVHSPGGQVWGTRELAATIQEIGKRGQTKVVTVGNSQVASAALWAGVQASQVYLTPGGEIGSLGVLRVHEDVSKAEENVGVKTSLVAIPERKVDGHPYAPLSEETRERWLSEMRSTYDDFLSSVASARRVTPRQAEDRFGGGGMLSAREAKEAGLIDGVKTLHEVVRSEVARITPKGKSAAANNNRLAILEKG